MGGRARQPNGTLGVSDTETVWRPQPGPQRDLVRCPLAEAFFGGSRGGGKTDGVLGKWAIKERRYAAGFNAVALRRTTVSFEDAIARGKQIYLPLGAKFTEKPPRFRMPNGGRISFSYLENVDDAADYQGRNVSDAWVEEAGQYPDPAPIDRLFGVLRSAEKVPVQLILTANPGGAGQHWIAERYGLIPFPSKPKVVYRQLPDGSVHKMGVIPSRITDNRILLDSDPGYISRLQLVGSAALVKAWLDGDWSAIEGAFFPEWSTARHVVEPFEIPDEWTRFRSGDWGSAKPFSIGWWAVVGDDARLASGMCLPRGALLRYREWYGSKAPNVGLKIPAEEVARGIVARELHEPRNEFNDPDISYSVMDPAAFASDGGPSIAERMATEGVFWARADNKRVGRLGALGGWDQVRSRLVGTAQRNSETGVINWSAGAPMIYFFSTCRDSIRTLPTLQHDKTRAEDVDTDNEDHAPDEIRYACLSRPYVTDVPQTVAPKLLSQATLDDLWEQQNARSIGRI